jgi:hypothetical protein
MLRTGLITVDLWDWAKKNEFVIDFGFLLWFNTVVVALQEWGGAKLLREIDLFVVVFLSALLFTMPCVGNLFVGLLK